MSKRRASSKEKREEKFYFIDLFWNSVLGFDFHLLLVIVARGVTTTIIFIIAIIDSESKWISVNVIRWSLVNSVTTADLVSFVSYEYF